MNSDYQRDYQGADERVYKSYLYRLRSKSPHIGDGDLLRAVMLGEWAMESVGPMTHRRLPVGRKDFNEWAANKLIRLGKDFVPFRVCVTSYGWGNKLVIRMVDLNLSKYDAVYLKFPVLAEWRADENRLYRSARLADLVDIAEGAKE
jgi:hypothetical protein